MNTTIDHYVVDVNKNQIQMKLSTAAQLLDMSTDHFKSYCRNSELLNPYTLGTSLDHNGRNRNASYIDWNEVLAWVEQQKVFNTFYQTSNSKA
jgi:hypothetical protein